MLDYLRRGVFASRRCLQQESKKFLEVICHKYKDHCQVDDDKCDDFAYTWMPSFCKYEPYAVAML
jgi:hypothetical protein